MKRAILYPSFLVFSFSLFTLNAQNIYTYAGNGTAAFTGDGGQATNAELNYPEGVAVDDSGNVYVADNGNDAIRMVQHATGIITTVAGTGVGGISPDGGPASSSPIVEPSGVALDDSGNIYFAETANHKIRKVFKSTGILTTVAGTGNYGFSGDGGPATSAELFAPFSLTIDHSYNIYIADEDNYRIREVTHSNGVINTVAGNGTPGFNSDGIAATSAELNYPTDVAVDNAGNLYISDYGNSRVRKVTISNGLISTFAGNGATGINGDGGQATSAELNYPAGVAFDNMGNLFIADEHNMEVREVDSASGIITDVAGTGSQGFSGDGGPATSADLWWDYGVCVDKSGDFFIADAGNNRVREVKSIFTGIKNSSNNSNISIFPNPASDKVYISGIKTESVLQLFTITGQLVWNGNNNSDTSIFEIPVNNLSNGIYFLKVQDMNGKVEVRKVEVVN